MTRRTVLAVAAVIEIATGFALLVDPAVVAQLLLGADDARQRMTLGRVAGIAMLALGLACWPDDRAMNGRGPASRGMLTYNVLITLYLFYLGSVAHLTGLMLWPAVAVHAVLTVGLIRAGSPLREPLGRLGR